MKVSVIIPCFNAIDKIGRCLSSLRAIDMAARDFEIIFVDDCSTDGTFSLLQHECSREPNWRVEQLAANSGSPSRPRNHGMNLAKGDYLFFLDCDDEILPDTLKLHLAHAKETKADIVRGYLLSDDGRNRIPMNRLQDWTKKISREERIKIIISRQSTVIVSLIRAKLLKKKRILWPEDIRMGEDTVFLVNVLAAAQNIEYLDHPTFIYNKLPSLTPSSTQVYGARELRDHLHVWTEANKLLRQEDINFISSRLQVSLQTALAGLLHRNQGDIDENIFNKFSAFICEHWETIRRFNYITRYKDILNSAHDGNFDLFKKLCRPRLVIAGYDLKFIKQAASGLESNFDIRFDEWRGHGDHDERQSRELLNWADYIWCEWLLGNAVWYTHNKRSGQRLIIRMHRFELSREFGDKLAINNVDAIVAVSAHFFERLLERFPNIPRNKARLLPNYVMTSNYCRDWNDHRLFTLGMIGILPSRKGLDKAIEVLTALRRHDPRYRLEIFGQRPEELAWIARDSVEMSYFQKCSNLIQQNNLGDAVSFNGHCDVKTALAKKHVGFILSTSDSQMEFPGPESFHLAIADGFAAGGIGLILDWMGAEYIWPKEFIFPSVDAIVTYIISFQGMPDRFRATSQSGLRFIEERYGSEQFLASFKKIFQEIV